MPINYYKGDVTDCNVDAIVVPVNKESTYGS